MVQTRAKKRHGTGTKKRKPVKKARGRTAGRRSTSTASMSSSRKSGGSDPSSNKSAREGRQQRQQRQRRRRRAELRDGPVQREIRWLLCYAVNNGIGAGSTTLLNMVRAYNISLGSSSSSSSSPCSLFLETMEREVDVVMNTAREALRSERANFSVLEHGRFTRHINSLARIFRGEGSTS
jgi:hypothetical protein